MKKFASIFLRLIFAALICLSGLFLFEGVATINVQNVPKMAKTVIDKNVNKTGDANLKGSLQLAKDFGVEDKIFEQLPKKYHRDLSYINLYNLSVSYQENGEVTAQNLNLSEKNQVQKAVNYVILERLNKELKNNGKQVNDTINVFHYFFFAAILLFAIAALLVLFGSSWASIVLLIASAGSFGALQYYLNQLTQNLQTELYHGISLTTSSVLWLGLAMGLVLTFIWPVILKITKKRE